MKMKGKEFPSPVLGEGSTPAGGRVRGVVYATRPPHPNPLLSKERGTTSLNVVALVLLCGVILAAFVFLNNKPCADFNQATLKTPTQTITLALANTAETQATGLSGCRAVPKNAGMYFWPFDTAQGQNATFWMKGMRIPIDIIWLRDNKVVGIERNVPNEPLYTPDDQLIRYMSPEGIDAVLEVGAGKAEEYGIVEGAQLHID